MRPKNQKRNESTVNSDLVLPSFNGAPIIAFPIGVIHPIRRLISRFDSKGEIPPRLAMAAALRREGVSYITWAFATTMAFDLNRSVCIVDLNWWWPSEIYPEPATSGGLGAVLKENEQLDRVVIRTGKPNLAYLPAGNLAVNERAYFARSDMLKETIMELSAHYDHLILDIPAVLASNDAISLASLATAFCLVIHQGVTSIDEAKSVISDLDNLPALGVVMNKYSFHLPGFLLKYADPQSIWQTQ